MAVRARTSWRTRACAGSTAPSRCSSCCSLGLPFALGFALTGDARAARCVALVFAGFVRIFLLHHVTWSVNSVCHFFGRRRFDVDDQSTNVAWLAIPSLGEAWHHNHHAFPRSARHGLRRSEIDITALRDPADEARRAWPGTSSRSRPSASSPRRSGPRPYPRTWRSQRRCGIPRRRGSTHPVSPSVVVAGLAGQQHARDLALDQHARLDRQHVSARRIRDQRVRAVERRELLEVLDRREDERQVAGAVGVERALRREPAPCRRSRRRRSPAPGRLGSAPGRSVCRSGS